MQYAHTAAMCVLHGVDVEISSLSPASRGPYRRAFREWWEIMAAYPTWSQAPAATQIPQTAVDLLAALADLIEAKGLSVASPDTTVERMRRVVTEWLTDLDADKAWKSAPRQLRDVVFGKLTELKWWLDRADDFGVPTAMANDLFGTVANWPEADDVRKQKPWHTLLMAVAVAAGFLGGVSEAIDHVENITDATTGVVAKLWDQVGEESEAPAGLERREAPLQIEAPKGTAGDS